MHIFHIQRFLHTQYSTEQLSRLLGDIDSGKLAYHSCCCFIGQVTAVGETYGKSHDHTRTGRHEIAARQLPGAIEAEAEFYALAVNDEGRRRLLRPLVVEELARREAELKSADVMLQNAPEPTQADLAGLEALVNA